MATMRATTTRRARRLLIHAIRCIALTGLVSIPLPALYHYHGLAASTTAAGSATATAAGLVTADSLFATSSGGGDLFASAPPHLLGMTASALGSTPLPAVRAANATAAASAVSSAAAASAAAAAGAADRGGSKRFKPTTTMGGRRGRGRRRRKHAYAFLMAGCDPSHPTYLGYVYNILVSARVLRTSNSTADIIVLVRMATSAAATNLRNETSSIPEQNLLERAGVIVRYIPTVKSDTFYTAMLDKFRILELVEYDRVLFLDSDVVPFCNLDYMFDASYAGGGGGDDSGGYNDDASGGPSNNDTAPPPPPLLQPNVILSFAVQPAQGGFFMLQPLPGDYSHLQRIVRDRIATDGDEFDVVKGWGHEIKEPDEWYSFARPGRNWTFYGAFADQGLLYHWVKYVKRNCTIIHRNKVTTWREVDPRTDPSTLLTGPIPVGNSAIGVVSDTADELVPLGCGHGLDKKMKRGFHLLYPPYEDFHHFTGHRKPWLATRRDGPDTGYKVPGALSDVRSPEDFWFYHLNKVKEELDLDIDDVTDLNVGRPILGLWPDIDHVKEHYRAEQRAAAK